MGSSEFQGKMWGYRARDWANYGESTSTDLFKAVLTKINDLRGSLLDIGCGSGGFCNMASESGFKTSGFDASESLIEIARERFPKTEFKSGEMEKLPYPNDSFDIATGFNSFQFAGEIVNALKETKRVVRKGGKVIMVVWGRPEQCQATEIFKALSSYMPPPPSTPSGRPPLFTEGVLETLASEAGLHPETTEDLICAWDFADERTALKAILSAGLISIAINNAGEEKVSQTVSDAIKQFKQPSGRVVIKNTFRCLVSKA